MLTQLQNIIDKATSLVATVTTTNTEIASAVSELVDLKTKLDAAIAGLSNAVSAEDLTAIQAAADSLGSTTAALSSSNQALADAVATNAASN